MLQLKRIYKDDPVLPQLKERRSRVQKKIDACLELLEDVSNDGLTKLLEALSAELEAIKAEQEKRFLGISIERAMGRSGWHGMTPKWWEMGHAEGWLRDEGDKLFIVEVAGAETEYKIEERPGYFCCHCGAKLSDGAGRYHVEHAHKNAKSPDEQNPSGYRKDNFYRLTLAAKED